ncbi:MAG: WecB/TagA/CpsF family glycosyltransferase [Candidatus Gracilibacteria bacterium]
MKLCGVNISAITKKEALVRVSDVFKTGKQEIIFTPNPEIILEASRNADFFEALKCGTLMLPDGHGLQFVSTLLQIKNKLLRVFLYLPFLIVFLFFKKPFAKLIPEIIHGSDFMKDVISESALRGKKVFFLGGRGDSAEKTAKFFKKNFVSLKVSGFSNSDPSEEALKKVLEAKPDVLFVAYGAPKQEEWACQHRKELKSLNLIMAVGGSFDFYSGNIKRAPRFFRMFGLEWLFRLMCNPIGRAKRIWNAVFVFPIRAMFTGAC